MQTDYQRLLQAASSLKGWNTPAEVVRGLSVGGYSVSDQILANWKSRGISAEGVLESCRIIGCRCEFIRTGTLPLLDGGGDHDASEAAHLRLLADEFIALLKVTGSSRPERLCNALKKARLIEEHLTMMSKLLG